MSELEVRASIVMFIKQYMDSPEKVTVQSQCECVMITEFIVDSLERGPQEFLSSEPPLPVEHKFLVWLVPSLLRVVVYPHAGQLESNVTDCVLKLLQFLRNKSCDLFQLFLSELFVLTRDLFMVTATTRMPYPLYLRHFNIPFINSDEQRAATDKIPDSPMIELTGAAQTKKLLIVSSKLLRCFVLEICQFLQSEQALLWRILCGMIKGPSLELKKGALLFVEELLACQASLPSDLLGQLCWCLVKLLHTLSELADEHRAVLESPLVASLTALFTPSWGETSLAPMKYWELLSTALTSAILSQLYAVCSTELQECIGQLLDQCLVLKVVYPHTIVDITSSWIGHAHNLRPFIMVTVNVIYTELASTANSMEHVQHLSNEHEGPPRLKRQKRDLPYDLSYGRRKMKLPRRERLLAEHYPLTAAVMHCFKLCARKLDSVTSSMVYSTADGNKLLLLLEGISFLIEVFGRCSEVENMSLDQWLTSGVLDQAVKLMEDCILLSSHKSYPADIRERVLLSVLDCTGLVLSVIVPNGLSAVTIDRCCWLMSLAWAKSPVGLNLVAGSTLTAKQRKDVEQVYSTIKSTAAVVKSLFVLGSIPRTASDTVIRFYFNEALCHPAGEVMTAAVSILPCLLVSVDSCSIPVLLESVMTVAREKWSQEACLQVANRLPAIAAVLCCSDMKKTWNSSSNQLFYQTCAVHLPDSPQQVETDKLPVFQQLCSKLLELANPPVLSEVIENIIESLSFTDDVQSLETLFIKLLDHSDKDILETVCSHIQVLLPKSDPPNIQKWPLFLKMRQLAISSTPWQRELAARLSGKLGMIAKGPLLCRCVVLLLELIMSGQVFIKAVVHVQVKFIAKSLNLVPTKLLVFLKESICELLLAVLKQHPEMVFDSIDESDLCSEIAMAFEYGSIRQFFQAIIDVLVPLLIAEATKTATAFLNHVAEALNKTPQELLLHNFRYIYTHLVCHCSSSCRKSSLAFLRDVMKVELKSVLRSEANHILNQLLLNLSLYKKRVKSGVNFIAKTVTDDKSQDFSTDKNLAIFLQNEHRLLGILAFFHSRLARGAVEAGKLTLSSLIELMKLMGPEHLTPVRATVMALLRLGHKFKADEVLELFCMAWGCFVRNIDIGVLGPLLSEIIVTLTPFIDQFPDVVSDVFKFLIVENEKTLSPFFHEVYSMPVSPALEPVNFILKKHSVQSINSSEPVFQQKLRNTLKGIYHERQDVRQIALRTLQSHLQSNQDELLNLIHGSDVTDPVITEVIMAILKGLKDSDTELCQMYGECLGMLGAVDPGRLKLPVVMSKKQAQVIEVEGKLSAEFVVELVIVLGKAFLGAVDAVVQDCCAFAIQDVLTVYDCANPEPTSAGAMVWAKLPDNTKELLSPYLHSRYSANYPKLGRSVVPVFNAVANMTFKDWIQKWTCQLIGTLGVGVPKRIFMACSLIFKYNVGTALFLLPYVLLCALQQGNEDVKMAIFSELMIVFNYCAPPGEARKEVTETTNMCTQALFTGLDYLQSWLRYKISLAATVKAVSGESAQTDQQHYNIESFLDMIPKDLLARAAYNCRAYARSLQYLEDFLSSSEESTIQKKLGFLQQIYDALGDSDGVAGVAAIRVSEPSLHEQILQYESTGAFHDAADCYTKAIQQDRTALDFHEGLLRCLMKFGDFTTAQMNVRGLLAERPEWHYAFNSYQVEAAWRLGDWDMLDHSLEQEPLTSSSWEVGLGRVLLAAKKRDKEMFQEHLGLVRSSLMGPLATASLELGSYQRGYEYIVRLHMLQEVDEIVTKLMFGPDNQSMRTLEKMLDSWSDRLKLTQESFKTKVSILNLRRVLLELVLDRQCVCDKLLRNEIGQFWLKSAKFARRAGYLQTAHSSLLHARDYSLSEFCIEHAEWKCNQADSHQALMSLQKAVNENWPTDDDDTDIESNSTHAKALLMIARWMEDTELDSATIIKHYKRAIAVNGEFEDGHFFLGRYYDKLMCALSRDQPAKYGDSVMQFTIQHYGSALRHGNKYIYHCMPRVLSLWLDYSNKQLGAVSKSSEQVLNISKLNTQVDALVDQLPPYQFLIAFSQLISRVCHPNPDVFKTLERIILKLLEHYPQQALWMMIAVSKSTHQDRQTRCRSIFDKAKNSKPRLSKLIVDMMRLCDKLQELCNKHVDSIKATTMDKLCRGLARLTNDRDFSSIMVPLQSSLNVTLPSNNSRHLQHSPFPGIQPTIVRFQDKVEILPSLQKPKKVFIVASDGKAYPMMCKPKDDLRKDCRLMEFNSVINKFLHKDPECRQRQLYVRTYAVVPLNEDCGMLEWVDNTTGLRNILIKIYKEKGIYMTGQKLKSIMHIPGREHAKLKDAFLNQLLPMHPPVFGEWFMKTFPDPTRWYSSRRCYARTTAVMSMVGYVLGLGDRHGENVMCDSINGDSVHVDFDCLFNKGSSFDWPEVVPFRLTQNMIHAMGITGYEGVFRNSCEMTMRVMREQRDPLMCVLKTFIHDPLVEWGKEKGKMIAGSKQPTEKTKLYNEKALKIVGDIEDRLQGKHSKGLPLSVKGQVHVLIKEATDIDNLCKMYVGWGAYL